MPIIVNAQFTPLSCTATGATLGSAGATQIFANFPNAPILNTWYSFALANKIAAADLDPGQPQINSRFNSNIGQPNCLAASQWYYGLDSNEPANGIDFVAVLQHEMGHGLGFQTFTSGTTGQFFNGPPALPSTWDHFLLDNNTGKTWAQDTVAERQASAIGGDKLVWGGATVTAAAPSVLRIGEPRVLMSGPASGALNNVLLLAGEATFGAAPTQAGVTGEVMPVVQQTTAAGLTGPACGPLAALDKLAVTGKIAIVDRGVCGFVVKAKNVQNAGAIGMIVADNAAGSPPAGMSGVDPTVTIPSVRVTQADGNAIKAALQKRSRTNSGVFARIGLFGTLMAGGDANGRVKMYTPNPFVSGSSVSHYDVSANRNLLMEPAINADLTQSVVPPIDLTFPLFQDIGW